MAYPASRQSASRLLRTIFRRCEAVSTGSPSASHAAAFARVAQCEGTHPVHEGEIRKQACDGMWRTERWRLMPGDAMRRTDKWRLMSSVAVEDSLSSSSSEGLTITDSCIRRLRDIQKEEKSEKLLRLSVEGGGCSGFLYSFSLEDTQKPDDRVFEKDGVKVIVDDLSFSFLKGSTIDFTEELIRSTFVVVGNPNSTSSCGCGSSFTAKS